MAFVAIADAAAIIGYARNSVYRKVNWGRCRPLRAPMGWLLRLKACEANRDGPPVPGPKAPDERKQGREPLRGRCSA